MDKNCSRCGIKLTFQNSFFWDKKPVCKSCLKELEQGHKFDDVQVPIKEDSPTVRVYSKGGIIATVTMVIISIATIATTPPIKYYTIIMHTSAAIALLVRSYRPPLKWWQGTLVWVGGFIGGFSIYALEDIQLVPSAAIQNFLMYFIIGIFLIFLGFMKKKHHKV